MLPVFQEYAIKELYTILLILGNTGSNTSLPYDRRGRAVALGSGRHHRACQANNPCFQASRACTLCCFVQTISQNTENTEQNIHLAAAIFLYVVVQNI